MQGLRVSDGVDALMAGAIEAFLFQLLECSLQEARGSKVRRIANKHISDVLHKDKAFARQLVPGIMPKGRWHVEAQTGWSDKRVEKKEEAPKKKVKSIPKK